RFGVDALQTGDRDEAARFFTTAAEIRRMLHRREPDRVDLAEELAVTLAFLGATATEDDGRSEIAEEIHALLGPFDERGVLTPKGRGVLDWIQDW
ncbi:hypothetical protein, partial [Frankia sp. CiP1_Cm_nod2]|uniref:hypothetical protein n=1 Tax=Frankia sp. CiP1_Cm_nod2 TaxID=2897161 RepID=UPI002025699C